MARTITRAPAAEPDSAVQVLQAENAALREALEALQVQIDALTSEISRVRSRELLTAADLAEAFAHMRAAAALYATWQACRDGIEQVDPMAHVVGFLEERGLLPDDAATASVLLSEAFARSDDAAHAYTRASIGGGGS